MKIVVIQKKYLESKDLVYPILNYLNQLQFILHVRIQRFLKEVKFPLSAMAVNKVDEESALRLELLRAQIELTKVIHSSISFPLHSLQTQQSAAEKQMEANISMIKAMNRMMERIEMKKEESNDQSSVTSLISIMKEMVKK